MKPYPEQISAAKTAAKAGRGCIVMPTGTGKSVTMALLINELQVKTLVVVPNLELKHQLTASFLKYFGSLNNITIENIDSPKLPRCTDYDCLIIDEAHHTAAKTYRDLNKKAWKGIYYRFFFTATAFRSRNEEQILLESIIGQVIYEVTYATAVDKGFIVPMEAYYIRLPKVKPKGNPKSWPAMYKELVVDNDHRNKIIARLLNNLNQANLSTLCLVKEVAHGERLAELTGIDFVKGENTDNRIKILEFNLRELNALIGTTGVIGEGVDTKPCEYVIIAGLGKSKNSIMQQIGRGFRVYPGKESCKIIIFYDTSHKWTKDHFDTQRKIILDEYGINVLPLEIRSKENEVKKD